MTVSISIVIHHLCARHTNAFQSSFVPTSVYVWNCSRSTYITRVWLPQAISYSQSPQIWIRKAPPTTSRPVVLQLSTTNTSRPTKQGLISTLQMTQNKYEDIHGIRWHDDIHLDNLTNQIVQFGYQTGRLHPCLQQIEAIEANNWTQNNVQRNHQRFRSRVPMAHNNLNGTMTVSIM